MNSRQYLISIKTLASGKLAQTIGQDIPASGALGEAMIDVNAAIIEAARAGEHGKCFAWRPRKCANWRSAVR
jgi:hypothetical protein